MKLRYSLRFLLTLPIVVAAAWSWVSWPSRTFGAFKSALVSERHEVANSMVHLDDLALPSDEALMYHFDSRPGSVTTIIPAIALHSTDPSKYVESLIAEPPRFKDVLLCRRVYVGSFYPGCNHEFLFVVERGRVTLRFR